MSILFGKEGLVKQFPWLQMSTLTSSFADHNLLYHVLLIPFLNLGISPLWGIKLAAALFAAIVIVILFLFLSAQKIKGSFWWSIFLLTNSPFLFRLNLPKAGSLFLIILLLALYCLFKKKFFILGALCFISVWVHASFPLLLIMTLIYSLIFLWQEHGLKDRLKPILAAALGCAGGLVLSPYFPTNLAFYQYQIFEIALKGYNALIEVGAEWYPYALPDFLSSNALLLIALVCATVTFVLTWKNQSRETLVLFFLTVFSLLLTLRSARAIEYFAPCAILFSAFSLSPFLRDKEKLKSFFVFPQNTLLKHPLFLSLIICYFIISACFVVARDLKATVSFTHQGIPFSRFFKTSQWLLTNTPPKSIIFHTQWDSFPILFYHNNQNYYLIGLDPVFAYLNNKKIYEAWRALGRGEKTGDDFYRLFHKTFPNISFIFVEKIPFSKSLSRKQDIALNARLKWSPYFKKVYQDEEAVIYQLNDSSRASS
jgi:hypothetical protein